MRHSHAAACGCVRPQPLLPPVDPPCTSRLEPRRWLQVVGSSVRTSASAARWMSEASFQARGDTTQAPHANTCKRQVAPAAGHILHQLHQMLFKFGGTKRHLFRRQSEGLGMLLSRRDKAYSRSDLCRPSPIPSESPPRRSDFVVALPAFAHIFCVYLRGTPWLSASDYRPCERVLWMDWMIDQMPAS